jgi:hypothetical protein
MLSRFAELSLLLQNISQSGLPEVRISSEDGKSFTIM